MAQLFSRAAHRCGRINHSLRRSVTQPRQGFTLVEVLVAMAITLLIMATIVTVFNQIGTSVADSRAGIEMSDQVQGVRDRLQRDLGGVTVSTKPWQRMEAGAGYVEVIEGPRSDLIITSDPATGAITSTNATTLTVPAITRVPATALGDFDDVLMFTSSDQESPFLGRAFRYQTPNTPASGIVESMVESNDAEIIWYAIEHPIANQGDADFIGEPVFRTIYRRALIISPGTPIPAAAHALSLREFYESYDISVRRVNSEWVPNSLADLTWRQNRFAHQSGFPHLVNVGRIRPFNRSTSEASPLGPLTGFREGEDIMLRNALAFDVRVYDPQAPLRFNAASQIVMAPGDPGWTSGGAAPADNAVGAFVDLNYAGSWIGNSWFSGPSQNVSGSGARLFDANWDTWPFGYEQDGVNQNGGSLVDEGTNGYDDNNNTIVDDLAEYETAPPYNAPLRGILVRVRAYEPFSRQVRDVSMVENFTGK